MKHSIRAMRIAIVKNKLINNTQISSVSNPIFNWSKSDPRALHIWEIESTVRVEFDCEIIVKVIKMQYQGTTCHMIVWEMSSFHSIQNSPYRVFIFSFSNNQINSCFYSKKSNENSKRDLFIFGPGKVRQNENENENSRFCFHFHRW